MANKKTTSNQIASLASKVLTDQNASATAKKLAGSALSQVNKGNQTGSNLEDIAAKVLSSDKYSNDTHKLAASVLSQANKER